MGGLTLNPDTVTPEPQIFVDGVSVGGFDEVNALDRKGELDVLVHGAMVR